VGIERGSQPGELSHERHIQPVTLRMRFNATRWAKHWRRAWVGPVPRGRSPASAIFLFLADQRRPDDFHQHMKRQCHARRSRGQHPPDDSLYS